MVAEIDRATYFTPPPHHPRFAVWVVWTTMGDMMNKDEKMTMLDLLTDMEFESEFADSSAAGVGRFEEGLRGIREQFLAVLEDNELSKKALKQRIRDILG